MKESPIYQDILEEGKQEGSQERAHIIAQNLLSIGMTTEQVATATGLTIDQVQLLQKG